MTPIIRPGSSYAWKAPSPDVRLLQARWTELRELVELGIGWDSPEKLRAVSPVGPAAHER